MNFKILLFLNLFFIISTAKKPPRRVPKVGGGESANIEHFPWQVMFVEFHPYYGTVICGGSLISSCFALTAAHCYKTFFPNYAFLGTAKPIDYIDNSDSDYELDENMIVTTVVEAFKHPDYDPDRIVNDIALVLFMSHVTFTDYIRPIKLPFQEIENLEGRQAVVAGYGVDLTGEASFVLNSFNSTILSSEECRKGFPQMYNEAAHLCVEGFHGKGDCQGDSGGALIITTNKRKRAVGVVSFGPVVGNKQCFHGKPSYYARVHPYMSWILETTKAHKPPSKEHKPPGDEYLFD